MAKLTSLTEIDPKLLEKKTYLENIFNSKIEKINIFICSKEEFQQLNQEDWIVAFAVKQKNTIFIINQEESGRNYDDWLKVIVHEVVHLYFYARFNTYQPTWFFEGIACYLAEQEKKEKKIELKDLLDNFAKGDQNTYVIGYNILKRILQ